jgi:Immunity protein family (Imm11)
VTTTIKCVDENESDITWWTEADERPDKIGQYRMITKLKIVPDLVQESQMFRVEGWEIALVISETVKVALEKRGVAGIRFEEV